MVNVSVLDSTTLVPGWTDQQDDVVPASDAGQTYETKAHEKDAEENEKTEKVDTSETV